MLDDKQIRALMQDAAEDVPSRVWEAVSSRLDEAAAKAAVPAAAVRTVSAGKSKVWKWAGASLAMAAALAAGLFFRGTADRTPATVTVEPSVSGEPATVAQALPLTDNFTGQTSAGVQAPVNAPVSVSDVAKASGAVLNAVPAKGSDAVAGVTSAPSADAAPSAVIADAPATEPSDVPASVEVAEETRDLLAEMRMEDARRTSSSRVSGLTFGASMGGNNVLKQSVSSMSSGLGTTSSVDRITEGGKSNFGIPFTLGVGLRFGINPKLSIGTGLDYSLLSRTFDGYYTPAGSTKQVSGEVRNTMHYIGIPLRLYYNLAETPFIKFYFYGGGEAEYCLANTFVFRSAGSDPRTLSERVRNLQFSAGIGLGVQFRLADRVGLYLDPGVNYYFYGSQPKSIRTEHPLMFNFNAGLRFDLK